MIITIIICITFLGLVIVSNMFSQIEKNKQREHEYIIEKLKKEI